MSFGTTLGHLCCVSLRRSRGADISALTFTQLGMSLQSPGILARLRERTFHQDVSRTK